MNKTERLMTKIALPEGCWLWKGSKDAKGYGRLRTGDRTGSRTEHAHRVMWEAIHGPLLPGVWVLHHCDTPACVRPDHLYIGTPADNARDRDVRGRNAKTKITAEQVSLARAAYAAGWTNARLARQFSISPGQMHAILHDRAWKHVR